MRLFALVLLVCDLLVCSLLIFQSVLVCQQLQVQADPVPALNGIFESGIVDDVSGCQDDRKARYGRRNNAVSTITIR